MFYKTEIIDGMVSVTKFGSVANFKNSTEDRETIETPEGVVYVDLNDINRDRVLVIVLYSEFEIPDPKSLKLPQTKNTSFSRKY